MWRFYFLKGYTLLVGAGLFVLGLAGLLDLTSYSFMPQPVELPDHVLHTCTGLLFIGGGWVMQDLGTIRFFVGGMGLLLVLSKIVLLGGRTYALGFLSFHFVGIVCVVVGVSSLLVALFIGRAPRSV